MCVYHCLSYPVSKTHTQYYIAICGLSRSATIFHISQTVRFFGGGGGGAY